MSQTSRGAAARIPLGHSYEATIGWLLNNRVPGAGLVVNHREPVPYPEVTGYTIPTLLACGERAEALELASWLVSIQRPDGGFAGPDGLHESYLFDTGQVLRGLLAVVDFLPSVIEPLRRAADWMLAASNPAGIVRPQADSAWSRRYGARIPEAIHLYTLPPLIEASRVLGQPKYAAAAQRSLDYYLQQPDLVEFTTLTHFFGYILEALVDLGHHRLAEAGLQQVVDLQEPSGLVPAQPGVRWMCTPGSAQLALVAYKLGLGAFADRALDYLQTVQEPSGGFMGSYGPGAAYGPDAEPSWACKYFLDACHWRIRARGDRQQQAPVLPEGSWAALGTAPMHLALRTALGELAGKRVLEVGCGRGERLWALRAAWPTAALCGVDNAQELLNALPPGIAGSRASTLNLPFPDGVFDAVVCTDGLAGTIRIERALTELCRVIKPGGHLVVGLDQDGPYADRMTIDARAQWFAPDDVTRVLRQYGTLVALESVELAKGSDHRVARLIWHAVRGETPVAVAVSPADLHRPVPEHPESRWDSHLPNRWAQRRALARALVEEGFTSYAGGDLAHARAAFLRAWRYDPVWLFNRGIVSIVVRSLGVPRPR